MVYRRKRSYSRFRRRSTYKRRFRRKYTRKPRTLTARVRSIEKSIETKWADATQTLTGIGLSFTGVNLLPRIDEGTGTGSAGDRIGSKINLRSLQTRLFLECGDQTQAIRLICVAFPVLTGVSGIQDVVQMPSTILADPRFPIQTMYKRNGPVKYKVLFDRVFYMNTTTSSNKVVNLKISLPKTGLVLSYANATSTQPEKNIINLYVVSDSSAIPNPSIVCNTRATYNDA